MDDWSAEQYLKFEDERTIRRQIQEMLHIEKIFDEAGIQDEIDAYAPLVPDGSNWKATMLIEYPDVDQRKRELARLIGIEDRMYVEVQGHKRVYAIADEDLERAHRAHPEQLEQPHPGADDERRHQQEQRRGDEEEHQHGEHRRDVDHADGRDDLAERFEDGIRDGGAGSLLATYWVERGYDAEAISSDLSQKDRERVMQRMRDRNLRWLPALERMLASERAHFVAVGALHLVGEDGLLALLEARGYSVERL